MGGMIDVVTGRSGRRAADASNQAAGLAAEGEERRLQYLMERERLPRQYSEGAMTQLAGLYGLPGGEGSQQELIDQAMDSPLYKQLIGNQKFGEEAILRNASATGGLRSGNAQTALSEYSTRSANEALSQAYDQQLQGLTGLAGLPSNANTIGQAMAAPSATRAEGMVAGANARQQADQALTNNMMGLGTSALMFMSDIRLKKNIKHVGEKNGHEWFTWDWGDNDHGLSGSSEGVMAHLVYEYKPEAIGVVEGNLMVDYEQLGVENA